GFSSVRQFNDIVRAALGRTPTELRRRRRTGSGVPAPSGTGDRLSLRLPFRRPMACEELLGFLGARAVHGVESYDGRVYARTLRLPHGHGTVTLEPAETHVRALLCLADLRDLAAAVGRCRRLLDLDADPEAVDAALAEDALLRPLVAATPGRRVPGAVDGFEIAVRALLGQQVSVAAARTCAARLAATLGEPLDPAVAAASTATACDGTRAEADRNAGADTGVGAPASALSRCFPDAAAIGRASDEHLGMSEVRRGALRAIARSVASGAVTIDPGADPVVLSDRLLALRGVGPWSATYIAMRALGDPDAFLPGDLGVRRAMERLGHRGTPAAALELAEGWRPWRAYAMVHLWGTDGRPAAGPRPTTQEAA
ncbi:MAG: DNA-3-methyladenine glycosylase family protein, partial [Acidimicrobiales bacterium]